MKRCTAGGQCCAGLLTEELEYRADEGPEGWVPLLVVRLPRSPGAAALLPAVIFLHATGVLLWELKPYNLGLYHHLSM